TPRFRRPAISALLDCAVGVISVRRKDGASYARPGCVHAGDSRRTRRHAWSCGADRESRQARREQANLKATTP
ncbi:unnamed protein product, partial [Closterium sp. Naga37s-1]